jgi:ferredoxin
MTHSSPGGLLSKRACYRTRASVTTRGADTLRDAEDDDSKTFLFIYSLYALKSYGKNVSAWPYSHLIVPDTYDAWLRGLFEPAFLPFRWLFDARAMEDILGNRSFQQGYLYSLLYTVVMTVFGYQAMVGWRGVARDPRYQTYRYLTLLAFQVGFFLLVNVVAVQALSVQYAWRAWGLYQPFPLFFNTFFWWYDGDPTWIVAFFVTAGVLGTLVAIPIAARKHGKRFCTWVCGCGGLAETLGDRWRHLAPKGRSSRAWEFQGVVILATSVIVGLVVIGAYETDGNNPWWRAYNYAVDFWLVAVIPIALYPFFGGKVWCRYNANSACIQCGICIDVCPMDVLSFSTEQPSVAVPALSEERSPDKAPVAAD